MGFISRLLQSYNEDDQTPVNNTPPAAAQAANTLPRGGAQQAVAVEAALREGGSLPLATTSAVNTAELYSNPRARTIKQLSLFVAGGAFFAASTFITRRAVVRKLRTTAPKFYTPTNFKPTDANGAVEAAEALALATINVGALSMMLTGGAMYSLDIVSVADMREKFRRRMGFDQSDAVAGKDGDQEIEEWVRGVLDKRESGDVKGVMEGLTALVGTLAEKEEKKAASGAGVEPGKK